MSPIYTVFLNWASFIINLKRKRLFMKLKGELFFLKEWKRF